MVFRLIDQELYKSFERNVEKNPEATAKTTEIPIFRDREFCKVKTVPKMTITMNRKGLAYCSIFFD